MLHPSPAQDPGSGMERVLLVLVTAVGGCVSQLGLQQGWSQWSHSSSVQDLVFFPMSGTTVMLEQQHSKGWECSGELQGGTVAVDLLIKINVLADKDDSAPIAITSQDPARQGAAHSCFLSSWSLCFAARGSGQKARSPQLPKCLRAPGVTCSAGGMLESLVSCSLGKGTVLAFQRVLRQSFASSPPRHQC